MTSGPLTVDIGVIASGAAITISFGNLVWLRRLEKTHKNLLRRLEKMVPKNDD